MVRLCVMKMFWHVSKNGGKWKFMLATRGWEKIIFTLAVASNLKSFGNSLDKNICDVVLKRHWSELCRFYIRSTFHQHNSWVGDRQKIAKMRKNKLRFGIFYSISTDPRAVNYFFPDRTDFHHYSVFFSWTYITHFGRNSSVHMESRRLSCILRRYFCA